MTSHASSDSNNPANRDGVVLQGYHKKLKTMKKKYFVLYSENGGKSARLEYYDSEKKFKARSNPKRTITLKNCFNINRRLDTKHNNVIALSTKEEVFCIVLETEAELKEWLRTLLALQRGEDTESDPPKPFFEHVWQVQVQRKGSAEEKGIIGKYYVCLTAKSLTLVRIGSHQTTLGENRLASVEFYLTTIRRCGDSQCFFYIEVGRHSAIGAGELWMQTEDPLIAQNMHTMIISAMSSSKNIDDGFAPVSRKRALSANEASKPIAMLHRRQTHSGNKPINSSPLSESPSATSSTISSTSTVIQNPIIKPSTSKALELSQTSVSTNSLNPSTAIQQQDLTNPQQSAISASHCCSSTRVTPVITSTSCNPHYPFTAPMRALGSQRRHSVSATATVCHQRTLSLPNGDEAVPNGIIDRNNSIKLVNQVTATPENEHMHQCAQPSHQRTRSLPLTEETCTENDSLQPSSLASTTAALKSFSNNSNLIVKIHCKSCPNRISNNKNSFSSSSFTSVAQQSICSSNNSNHLTSSTNMKRKLSYPGCASGNIHIINNNTQYVNGHNGDEGSRNKWNDKNNNNGNITNTAESKKYTQEDMEILGNKNAVRNFLSTAKCSTLTPVSTKSTSTTNNPTITTNSLSKKNVCSSPTFLRRGRNIRSSRSFALGRDRCDSLPSRNRTASECSNSQLIINSSMPPPSRPTLSNRPLSMCIGSRHSHSPPLNTLSPSTGCSESDGSSLSIDEPDSFVHSITPDESGNFVGRYFNSHSSGGVIPEENCDDTWFMDKTNARGLDNMNNANGRLTLPISTTHNVHNMRKSSPAASQAGSVDMQSQYMDMFSPYSPPGTSPCEQSGNGFMPVSPSTDYPRGLYTGSSGGHSRASSLAEETVDGYVPMCPPVMQDYVDMEQTSKNHVAGGLSSAASTCSITSGTPSTDIRFAEYPLDKVKSRFTPDDEDLQPSGERPIRAYSVGSRPEHIKRKLRVDAINTADQNNSRVRAFSVGSRAKVPRCDLYRGVFGPSLISCHTNNNNYNNNTLNDTLGGGNSKSKKSSSAPILVHKSQNSVDRMGDLMEIDFSKNSENHNHTTSSNAGFSQPHNNSHSQVTTTSARLASFPLSVPSAQQKREFFENSPKEYAHGYMVMKPGSCTEKPKSNSGHRSIDNSGYLEMRPIGATKTSSLSSSPIKASTSAPKSISGAREELDYMNMSPGSSNLLLKMNSEDYMNINLRERHMETEWKTTKSTSSTDGYMEMSFNKERGGENAPPNSSGSAGETIVLNRLSEPRNVSLPIDIVSKEKLPGLSLCDSFSKLARRSDSHDSDIVGPISSHPPAIFPFSPESPAKCFLQSDYTQRKCFVDATSGTVTLPEQSIKTESVSDLGKSAQSILAVDQTVVPLQEEKILNTEFNVSKKSVATSMDALSSDYADMSLGSINTKTSPNINETLAESASSDYVNYVPPAANAVKLAKADAKNEYASMNQNSSKKTSPNATPNPVIFPSKKPLVTIASRASDSSSSFTGFKPISSSNDEFLLKSNTRGANSPKSVNRQLSDQYRALDDNASGYELLQMRSDSSLQTKKILSRPNSVNSEKISPLKTINRPSSANSECMPSISTSSSTSTLCGSSSSSSTLCGSKSQSPLTSSRPQSFSDTITAGAATSRNESVNSIVDPLISSRPPSVSSERELHYVSLDLPPASNTISLPPANNIDSNSSASTSLAKGNSSTSGESSTSPSPNASGNQQQPTFSYAQIDFNKSESLKMSMNVASNLKN